MGDYGIKVSRKGYDVKTCADRQLLFNSSWPLLKIYAQGSFTISDPAADQTIYTHNLGYVPAWWSFDTSGYIFGSNGQSKLMTPGTSQYMVMGSTKLEWKGAGSGLWPGTITGRYYIFTHNLATTFTAPVITTTAADEGDSGDYGIKVTVEGKDITSTDYRDYIVHSGLRTLQISKCGYGTKATGTVTVTHNLGYKPLYFLFMSIASNGNWNSVFSLADDFQSTATNTQISFWEPYGGDYSYIILKDPLELT